MATKARIEDKILERNYRTGEITSSPCTRVSRVFVEMKTRISDAYSATVLAFNPRKQFQPKLFYEDNHGNCCFVITNSEVMISKFILSIREEELAVLKPVY